MDQDPSLILKNRPSRALANRQEQHSRVPVQDHEHEVKTNERVHQVITIPQVLALEGSQYRQLRLCA